LLIILIILIIPIIRSQQQQQQQQQTTQSTFRRKQRDFSLLFARARHKHVGSWWTWRSVEDVLPENENPETQAYSNQTSKKRLDAPPLNASKSCSGSKKKEKRGAKEFERKQDEASLRQQTTARKRKSQKGET